MHGLSRVDAIRFQIHWHVRVDVTAAGLTLTEALTISDVIVCGAGEAVLDHVKILLIILNKLHVVCVMQQLLKYVVVVVVRRGRRLFVVLDTVQVVQVGLVGLQREQGGIQNALSTWTPALDRIGGLRGVEQ